MIQRGLGVLLFVLGFAVFNATVLRVPLADSPRLDLHPKPDAEHYLAGAVSIYRHHQFAVELGGQLLPPRYPFGYSLLMVPWLAAGATPVTVPFRVNNAVGLALLVGLFAAFWRRSPLAGGVGVVLLASWPAFIVACRSPLSEASGGAVALLAFWGLVVFAAGGSWVAGVCGGLLLGVSVWFRIANVLLAPVVILTPLALRVSWNRRAGIAAALSAAFAFGLSPLLWYNFRHFGSAFRTGYAHWLPRFSTFGLEYFPRNISAWWMDLSGGTHTYNTADLYGTRFYLSPALLVLLAVTLIARLRRRADLPAAATIILSVGALTVYFFQDARLLFPTLLIAIPFVARESAALLQRAADRRLSRRLLAALVVALIAATVNGYPRRGGRLGLDTALDFRRFTGHSSYYRLVQQLDRAADGRPALVLAAFAPIYIAAVASVSHVVVPLSNDAPPLPRLSMSARKSQMLEAIATNRPIYLVIGEGDAERRRLATPPAGYGWTVLYAANGVQLAQLVPSDHGDMADASHLVIR